jgi:type II secretory pathway pseudopilin PulG
MPHPAGVTMSEVLISMLIMSIGVIGLATLFPISVLRSIQASQLTNASLLSKNALARLQFDKSLLNNTTIPSTGQTVERRIIDPFGVVTEYGLPGNLGGVTRISPTLSNKLAAENLAMLPDSWVHVRTDDVPNGYTSGSHNITVAAPGSSFQEITPRTLAGAGMTRPLYRLNILDVSGKLGQRRTLRQLLPPGNVLSWEDPSGSTEGDLPMGFVPSRCRIEVRDDRYTWIMTVRKRWNLDPTAIPTPPSPTSWVAEVDLTVFFNRSFDSADENLVTASALSGNGFDQQPGVSGVDDDLNFTTDNPEEQNWPGSDDMRTLTLTSLPRNLKKGGFLFEPNEARWYRVIDVNSSNSANVLVLVDRDLANPSNIQNAIFMKGIVHVFEMGQFRSQ